MDARALVATFHDWPVRGRLLSVVQVANYIKPYRWNYVRNSEERDKVVHLFQDPSSLECVMVGALHQG